MAAQLIVVRRPILRGPASNPGQRPAETDKENREERVAQPAKDEPQPDDDDPYGPDWIPIGTMAISGQHPVRLGHFRTVEEVLASPSVRMLPGGSNTVFATVQNLQEIAGTSLRRQLGDLPNELTIIVHEGETLA